MMGEDHLAELLPELCASATSKNPYVREGHLTLFRYLPLTMEQPFQDHLGEVLPLILDGLSDEVRDRKPTAVTAQQQPGVHTQQGQNTEHAQHLDASVQPAIM